MLIKISGSCKFPDTLIIRHSVQTHFKGVHSNTSERRKDRLIHSIRSGDGGRADYKAALNDAGEVMSNKCDGPIFVHYLSIKVMSYMTIALSVASTACLILLPVFTNALK